MKTFQMWTFMPTTAPLVPYLKPDKLIYYCVDEWSAFTFLNGQLMDQMEQSLIRQSDLVIASAEKLYATKRHLNPETHLVSHGVDSEHFATVQAASTEIAAELRNIGLPSKLPTHTATVRAASVPITQLSRLPLDVPVLTATVSSNSSGPSLPNVAIQATWKTCGT